MTGKFGEHLVCLAPDGGDGEGPIEFEFEVGDVPAEPEVKVDPKVAALEQQIESMKAQIGLSQEERERLNAMQQSLSEVAGGLKNIPVPKVEQPAPRKSWEQQKREFAAKSIEDPEGAAEILRESIRSELIDELKPVLQGMGEELVDLRARAQESDVRKNPVGAFVMEKYGDEVRKVAKEIGGRNGLEQAMQRVGFAHMDEYVQAQIDAKMKDTQGSGSTPKPSGPKSPTGGAAPAGEGVTKKTVRLTPEQAADADRRGVSYKNYAKHVLKLDVGE